MIKVYIIESSNAAAIAAAGDGSQSRLQAGLDWFQMVFGCFGGVFCFICAFVFLCSHFSQFFHLYSGQTQWFTSLTYYLIPQAKWAMKKGIILPKPFVRILSLNNQDFWWKVSVRPGPPVFFERWRSFEYLAISNFAAVTGGLPTA